MKTKLLLFLLVAVIVAACSKDDDDEPVATSDETLNKLLNGLPGGKSSFILPLSNDLPSIPQDPNNPLTAQKIELGRLLFHETGLGSTPKLSVGMSTYSCASCHHAGAGFQAGIQQGIGEGGMGFGVAGEGRVNDPNWPIDSLDVQPIRTPSALNVAFQQAVLWNGQFGAVGPNVGTEANWTPGTPKEVNNLGYEGAETQAIAGLKVHRMMVSEPLITSLGYKPMFDQVFGSFPTSDRYTNETAGLAIAAYERSITATEAPFQQWLQGETGAMTEAQKQGAIIFFGSGGCASCHNGPALNSMEFHGLGMNDLDGPGVYGTTGASADEANRGRGGFTGNSSDDYKFKVPQLYNLKDSPFMGHGGNFNSVLEVVQYKNAGQAENSNVPSSQIAAEFTPLNLTDAEVASLVDFIENALFDPNLDRYVPGSVYSGNCIPNADAQSMTDLGCQ